MATTENAWPQEMSEAAHPSGIPILSEIRELMHEPNVGLGERVASSVAGAALAWFGAHRRDSTGWILAGVGTALIARGATGHCPMYSTFDINTREQLSPMRSVAKHGIHVAESMLINKSPEELYAFWKNLENLPRVMKHLKSVQMVDEKRSHWIAKAPNVVGGQVEWDAETIADEPNSRIEWRSMAGADIDHRGSVRFKPAPGNRGTHVRVHLHYVPPAGQIGRWTAKLFGEEPEQQVWDDLRNFKRMMEVGELPTTEGQPGGTCTGMVRRMVDRF